MSAGNALWQFVDKVKSSGILAKHNQLSETLGRLTLAREKAQILETSEAFAVLSRIDSNYSSDLKKNVEGIFSEEVEGANAILDEISTSLTELQDLLDTLQQRMLSEKQSVSTVQPDWYEDARVILMYLKLRTNILKLVFDVPFDEFLDTNQVNRSSANEFDQDDFLFSLSKLETICLQFSLNN